jgi:hypothetical protein
MRYEKPIVMDLSRAARSGGQQPLSCFDGGTPSGPIAYCRSGGAPASPLNPCVVGPGPGGSGEPVCYAGVGATIFCEAGGAGSTADTCTAGPSNIFP